MARRVSWTNNSSGHLGTYVYRAPTLDPQNLPTPVATVDPVAQGETAEWVDNEDITACYAVRDYDGQGAGTLSADACVTGVEPFDPNASIGDYTGGGVYAGTKTIGGTNYHIISGKADSEQLGLMWKTSTTATSGTKSDDDGLANTLAMETAGLADHPAADYCLAYEGGGHADWYIPAISELQLLYNNLRTHADFSSGNNYRWSSTEGFTGTAEGIYFVNGAVSNTLSKTSTSYYLRPIRRIPV